MQDLDEDETIQSLVQLKDLRSFEQQAASAPGAKIEDARQQREKKEIEEGLQQDGSAPSKDTPAAAAVLIAESVVAPISVEIASATPIEEEEYRPLRSIAAITSEERRKRAERRKIESGSGGRRKHSQEDEESDSDFEMEESEEAEEEEEEEEEESEDGSDDEYSEGERSRRRSSRATRRREHYDKETHFYVNGTHRERGGNPDGLTDGGNNNGSPSPSSLHAEGRPGGSASGNGRMGMMDKSAANKRKYNRFNRRNLSFDDRCQQLLEFKQTYGHCHVKRTHPGETKGLAYWVERQRMAWRKGTLELDKKKRLDDIGFVWEAGTNGSGSDELREYEALHASNRIKAEFAAQLDMPGESAADGASTTPRSGGTRAEGDATNGGGGGEERGDSGELPVPREENRERSRDDTVTRRGRLKLEEAKSFDDWCALLQQFKDKHGHCDVKRRYFGKNKGLAYWAERQRASRRKGSLEEEKINRLDSMGFVWGNNEGTVTPRKSSNANDSMDYSCDASVDAEMEEVASPVKEPTAAAPSPTSAQASTTTTTISVTPPPAARFGVPRAAMLAGELDSRQQQETKKAVEWEKVHRKDKEQLDLLKRKLDEEERRTRTREKKLREEKREWEEESINLQLENCLLKEKLLTLDEEMRIHQAAAAAAAAITANVKRKRQDEEDAPPGQDLEPVASEAHAEKRRRTERSNDEGDKAAAAIAAADGLLPLLRASAHSPRNSSATEPPTDLWALLCAIEGHLRSIMHGQKAISSHQRALLDVANTESSPINANDDDDNIINDNDSNDKGNDSNDKGNDGDDNVVIINNSDDADKAGTVSLSTVEAMEEEGKGEEEETAALAPASALAQDDAKEASKGVAGAEAPVSEMEQADATTSEMELAGPASAETTNAEQGHESVPLTTTGSPSSSSLESEPLAVAPSSLPVAGEPSSA